MRVGSLCTGYGGLDMAVERVLGGKMIWYSEFEKHPSTLLSARFPGVPNIGDLTKVDWASLPEIDILTGGYPCQPFSQAGKRLGENDPRHLWPHIREAVRVLRPRITILENVAGHRSKGFSTVLRDCAEDGLHVRWVSVRASDAGAPHKRDRIFFSITDPAQQGLQRPLLQRERHVPLGERRGKAATNSSDDGLAGVRETRRWGNGSPHNDGIAWGEYEPAIRRWESLLGRAAPDPTEPNKNGRPRLTVAFDEWMMGLPEGWVGDIDIPYGAKIKLCGNGVVPQQAELALRLLLDN